jgi:hypothetical protein
MLFADTVGVFFDSNVAQIKFAAEDVKEALESKNLIVEMHSLTMLNQTYPQKKIIIALASNNPITNILTKQGGSIPSGLGEQAYGLCTTTNPVKSYWVLGGDVNGAMYGALQIAENIKYHGFTETYNLQEAPFVLNRGIKANLPLDARSPTYYGSGYKDASGAFNGKASRNAIPNVWDMDYWTEWFDEMARNRFNEIAIWNCHPFPAMLDMEEAFDDVQGFDGYAKTMTKSQKIAFWKEVMAYGKSRGFKIHFITWNIYSYGCQDTSVTNSYSNQATIDYFRKAVRLMFETYPDLDGLGISAGENMRGMSTEEKIDWVWQAYGQGIMDFMKTHSDRKVTFIHRWLDADVGVVAASFKPLVDNYTNFRLDMSFKYALAHLYSIPDPIQIYMKDGVNAIADLDKTNGIKTWLEFRNDDYYFLSWGDPQFAREMIYGLPDVNKYIEGFFYGGDGWTNTRDFTSKSSVFKGMLEIKREWLTYKIWGRIAYNPQTPNEVFVNELANRYPGVNVQTLFDAWQGASRGIPLATEMVGGLKNDGDGNFFWDWQWWPELCTSNRGLKSLLDFSGANPSDGSSMCSIKNTADNNCSEKKRTSYFIADTIQTAAQNALIKISSLETGGYADLKLYQKNIAAQCYLSLYLSEKIRGATFLSAIDTSSAQAAIGNAYCHWIKYTSLMDELYTGCTMQRTNGFSNWSVYNSNVLKEYTDLGGKGIPNCDRINGIVPK